MTGTILIVGDQHKDGAILKAALKKETHFSVYLLSAEEGAPEAIGAKEPDLLVMNPKDSYSEMMDLYYRLRKVPKLEGVPLVFLVDEKEMRTADLPANVSEVLYRPLRTAEAVSRLRFLFKKILKTDQQDIIHSGKLKLDLGRYEVRVGERKIDLTYTEFELLKFLSSNPGIVFTREVLLNKVWGYEYYGGTRTVDVHIRRLRSKIEGKSSVFIDTVRNIGYKFIENEE